jgi:hypothetical protein
MEADVSMEALVDGEGVPIGSDTEMVVLDPTASDHYIDFTIAANAALEPVLNALRGLPEGTFETVYDAWEALGGTVEHVSGRPDRHSGGGR